MARKMKKTQGKRPSVLLALYDNPLLRTKVDSALDMGNSLQDITRIAKSYGLDISAPSLSRYSQARSESIRTGQALRKLLDGSTARKVADLKQKEVDTTPITGGDAIKPMTPVAPQTTDTSEQGEVTKYISDYAVLDTVIAQGLQSIVNLDAPVAPKDLLKAIEVKAKLSNNANSGLSIEGLQELRVRTVARDNAVAQAMLKFVPEDKQAEAMEYISKAEEEMLKNMDVSPQGRQILRALKDGGIKL